MTDTSDIVRLAIVRRQLERQMIWSRTHTDCVCKSRKRSDPDIYRIDKTCDMCGPYVASFHRARTQLDRAVDGYLSEIDFDPEGKAHERMEEYLKASREYVLTLTGGSK